MVVDGRTELASPDLELARLLLRGGKPVFLAVNKMDTDAMLQARRTSGVSGFRNVLPISAEHGTVSATCSTRSSRYCPSRRKRSRAAR